MTKWTHRDQQQLEELLNRRTRHVNAARAEVVAVVARAFSHDTKEGHFRIADRLMEYAEPLRDALAPLDTGVRVEAPKAE